ncbi:MULTISPECIES: hypothetical protein [Polymorphospora]|uniref:BMP family ABC transporter substrate-binding protein n=1 Tax=Polymorphospora lycopeni TaxID=3140240 RepID=A0ABV5CXS4_9ACTN
MSVALVVAVGALLTWVLWPEPESEPRAREYRDVTACLLTGASGVQSPEAAPIWSGMQDASVETLVKVQFLEVDGPQTAENAGTFLASLAQSRCDTVITVGDAPVAALQSIAPRFPNVRFVGIGGGASLDNVSVVEAGAPDDLRSVIRRLVTEMA